MIRRDEWRPHHVLDAVLSRTSPFAAMADTCLQELHERYADDSDEEQPVTSSHAAPAPEPAKHAAHTQQYHAAEAGSAAADEDIDEDSDWTEDYDEDGLDAEDWAEAREGVQQNMRYSPRAATVASTLLGLLPAHGRVTPFSIPVCVLSSAVCCCHQATWHVATTRVHTVACGNTPTQRVAAAPAPAAACCSPCATNSR